MKIGILTFHNGINYGAFFQVYALQNFLLRYGFECQVINYKNLGFTLREYRCFLGLRGVSIVANIRNIIKIAKFKIAHRKLNLTNRVFSITKLAMLNFDSVIIGSDEVWNFNTDLIGYDPVYFSQGLKARRIISYAASFGTVNAEAFIPKELCECLKKIEYVSVRDNNSKNIICSLTTKPVEIVLDPTFLIDLKPEAIISPKITGFILIYGFFTEKMIAMILEYAHFSGKKTVSVSYGRPWCDIDLTTLSPFQWLGYFVNCDCVITTMYHGMIFSVLNQKEFCIISSAYRINKVGNFLSEVGLAERMVEEGASIKDVFDRKINYLMVNRRVEDKRKKSEDFLFRALHS